MDVTDCVSHPLSHPTTSASVSASQENDQMQANASGAAKPAFSGKQEKLDLLACAANIEQSLGAAPKSSFKGTFAKGKGKSKPVSSGNNGSVAGINNKLLSPQEMGEAAREVKDKLPELSEQLLADLKSRGLEPCTLQEVLDERGLQWAATQVS